MTKVLNAKDIAATLDTDTRTLRKFLRSDASPIEPVGKGGRYSIEGRQMRSLTAAFKKWDANRRPADATPPDAD